MIAVIDYGAGNIRSISRGLNAAGADTVVVEHGQQIGDVDALVLPGVGHAGHLMQSLQDRSFDTAITSAVEQGIPFLGICVGLQIMFGKQEEGDTYGLGLIPGRVVHLPRTLKTPHMGWSLVNATRDSGFGPTGYSDYFYYVHSFAAEDADGDAVVATTDYGVSFPAVVIQDHLWGCQFHPEKSSEPGIAFLRAFVSCVQSRVPVAETVATG
jgi:glutamine amidotransferase